MRSTRVMTAVPCLLALWSGASQDEPKLQEPSTAMDPFFVRLEERKEPARRLRVFAREKGSERQLWSIYFPLAAPGERILCGARGAFVLRVVPEPEAGAPAVALYTARGEERRWAREDLHRAAEPHRWLAEGDASIRLVTLAQPWGDEQLLLLAGSDGAHIHVDPLTGRVDLDAPGDPATIACEPAAPEEQGLERVYIEGSEALPVALAGEPLRVRFRGSVPTPGWTLAGFRVAAASVPARGTTQPGQESERPLEIVALARPPAGGVQAQVLVPFEAEVLVRGLPHGTWVLRIPSRAEGVPAQHRVRVWPASLSVALHQSGGIAGIDRSTIVHADGWVDRGGARPMCEGPRSVLLTAAQRDELHGLLARLPSQSLERRDEKSADLFQYELVWRSGDALRRALVDDATLGELSEPIRFLRELE